MPEVLPFVQLGALGVLVALVYYLARILARGDWVPRATVDVLLTARDAEILRSNERAEEWHTAWEAERHVTELIREQNRDLLVVARTVEHVMVAMDTLAKERKDA